MGCATSQDEKRQKEVSNSLDYIIRCFLMYPFFDFRSYLRVRYITILPLSD